MKNITKFIALSASIATLIGGAVSSQAQEQQQQGQPGQRQRGGGGPGGGGFDREEMMKRISDRMKEQFGVTNDDEWSIINERIQKVFEARRATSGGGGSVFGSSRGPGGGGPGGPGGGRGPGGGDGGGRGPGGGDGGERSSGNPEVDALRKAIEAKASDAEITEKLGKVRESRKASAAKLVTAQKELLEVLTPRQEAVAVMMGLLD